MTYVNEQREQVIKLISEGTTGVFGGDTGGGVFRGKPWPFVLQSWENNFYQGIKCDVIDYFKQNKISWWRGNDPTTHALSSQIACLNHLFPVRNDEKAVLNFLKVIDDGFDKVYRIPEEMEGYISFEAVGGKSNYLNEGANTRGSNCTSVDALIFAHHKNGKKYLIPVEWKYTEKYPNIEMFHEKKVSENGAVIKNSEGRTKGEERQCRYYRLIEKSPGLKTGETKKISNYEPFYQLMRQTLWAEQIILNKVVGLEADDYLHLHIVPDGNAELLNKKYKCSDDNMETTWKSCLEDPSKYIVISPEKLWGKQDPGSAIYQYLKHRYWG